MADLPLGIPTFHPCIVVGASALLYYLFLESARRMTGQRSRAKVVAADVVISVVRVPELRELNNLHMNSWKPKQQRKDPAAGCEWVYSK
jgi:hypothetical protein